MDDEALTARLAADLDGSFEALVLAHQDRLYTIALRIVADGRDAEEVAQDALVRAYRAIATYEPARIRELRLRPWLAAIVVNLARNRATRRRQPPSVPLDGTAPDGTGSWTETLADETRASRPEVVAERNEDVRHWAGLVAALPDRYRVPVVLRHVDGLSFGEIGEALERPEGTVKAQVHRGLALLRDAHRAAQRSGNRAEREEMSA